MPISPLKNFQLKNCIVQKYRQLFSSMVTEYCPRRKLQFEIEMKIILQTNFYYDKIIIYLYL